MATDEVGTSTEKTSHLQACGVQAARLDPAKGLEAGLAFAAGVLSVRSDLPALRPAALLLHHPLMASYHPAPHNPVWDLMQETQLSVDGRSSLAGTQANPGREKW